MVGRMDRSAVVSRSVMMGRVQGTCGGLARTIGPTDVVRTVEDLRVLTIMRYTVHHFTAVRVGGWWRAGSQEGGAGEHTTCIFTRARLMHTRQTQYIYIHREG